MDSPEQARSTAQDRAHASEYGQQLQTDWASTLTEPRGFVWYTSLLVSLLGVVSFGSGHQRTELLGVALLATGGTSLALLALATEFQVAFTAETDSTSRLFTTVTSALVFVVAVVIGLDIFQFGTTLNVRVVVVALGLQALFLTVDIPPSNVSRRSRAALLFFGHGAVLCGSAVTLTLGTNHETASVLLYVVGFSFVSLQSFWSRQRRVGVTPPRPSSRRRYWESLLLLVIIAAGISAVTISFLTPTQTWSADSGVTRIGTVVIGTAGVVALGMLSVPESPPQILRYLTRPTVTIVQHVATILVLTNTLLLTSFLLVPMSFSWVLTGLLVLLSVGVTINYLALGYSFWREDDSEFDTTNLPSDRLTVVITAANESDVLTETLEHNLSALPATSFLLVGAENSTDGTLKTMHSAAETDAPSVEVVRGTTGSKAGDLNEVWDRITTPYVLLLDADETLNSRSVATAVRTLDTDETVGIAQGRKTAAHPTATPLSRFVTIERQHSTWVDHPFMADVYRAAHFAGSAAVVRQEAVSDIGGFDPTALTEDIELSVRLYLETDWSIEYSPVTMVRELNPKTWASLTRQRERWARGWAQVATRHLERIIRSAPTLSWRRTTGLCWELFTAVSSPVYTLFPALVFYWIVSQSEPTMFVTSAVLAGYLAVERGLSFGLTALRDPDITLRRRPRAVVEAVVFGYAWLLFGWVVQLHSLYLQLAGAAASWDVTQKHVPTGHPRSKRNRDAFRRS